MATNDGGPAFPCDAEIGRVVEFDESLDQNVSRQLLEKREGMSLRDYFAAKAMSGLLADGAMLLPYQEGWEKGPDLIARIAFRVADAMLGARAALEGGAS